MSIKEPQLDLPRGVRGGADVWDQPQASVLLADDYFDAGGAPAGVTVTLAVTDAADTLAATASLEVKASASLTDQADTLAAVAGVSVVAAATLTDQADTVIASVEVVPSGVVVTLSVTDQADTVAAAAAVTVVASASITDAADTASGAAAALITAALTQQDAPDTLSASVEVLAAGGVSVTADLTDEPDVLDSAVTVDQPDEQPETITHRSRRRRLDGFRTWTVTADAQISDDDDTLTADAVVHAVSAPQIIVGASLWDDDDNAGAVAVVRWPVRGLLRTSPPLIRTTAAAGR